MRGASYRAFILTIVVAGLWTGGISESAAQGNKVLLLGILQDGQLLAQSTKALADKLVEHSELISVADLTEKDRRCEKGSCLDRLGKLGARFLMWGRVLRSAQGAKRINLQAYDAQTGEIDDATGTLYEGESLEDCVQRLGSELLLRLQTPIVGLAPRRRLPVPDALVVTPVEGKPRWPVWRTSVATALGLISAVSLAGAIPLSILQGKRADGGCTYNGKSDACVWNFASLIVAGYSIAASSLVGFGLTLGAR